MMTEGEWKYGQKAAYQVVVLGQLKHNWSQWFDEPVIIHGTDEGGHPLTRLTWEELDQAALRGVLGRIFDLNLTIFAVNRIESQGQVEGGCSNEG